MRNARKRDQYCNIALRSSGDPDWRLGRLAVAGALLLFAGLAFAPAAAQQLIVNGEPVCHFSEQGTAHIDGDRNLVINDSECEIEQGEAPSKPTLTVSPSSVNPGGRVTV